MATKNTQVKAKNSVGNEISLSHSQTDSPILDVNSLERLNTFRPDLVDFVIKETGEEAKNRRKREVKIDWFTFIERMGALLLAAGIATGGIFGSIYAAANGYEKLSWIIASTCIGSLAIAFLKRNR
ncbi:hypothetical protein HYE54_00405 [Aggregatibacter actinomycetemcomitans]|uniref:hypothetical protein n=1 Tax=Aggregatibacter actinomycetemcomitans TaxID=714 RepID=UPI0001B9F3F1|nr:hypothetical protein [Aggregatibacter actinomycetemcomitans]ACX82759.1 hypothetical protein D11S_1377 [Aggregatibacter actinomycetemcomitans D11S-1]KOE58175.1 hypothetical protein SCC2302_0308005 [Aggregatibacter actinomycetemcomitans serotype c str. SCC2302]KOE58278.1 hypothetical protein AAS4A_0207365 [Aggregatibacter actinomycetemcomitans serotype c str. AAS4A]KOE59660.1 hypothetical protein D17P2_0308950 [Aggregatibacter actinomycetemcomitans serotype c str. D17P-2]KYK75371.1 hypothetic